MMSMAMNPNSAFGISNTLSTTGQKYISEFFEIETKSDLIMGIELIDKAINKGRDEISTRRFHAFRQGWLQIAGPS